MRKRQFLLILIVFFSVTQISSTASAEKKMCKTVRLADIGWTDVAATTAVAATLLEWLGYEPKISLLSMPVTFKGLAGGNLDVFTGNWMPTQKADIEPYLKNHSVVQLTKNLEHAKYTLAVPDYVYNAGVHSIADIIAHREKFDDRIYGIEPGNDGNRQILRMISDDAFGLKGFEIVESSEQGMLVAVKNAIRNKDWIVFLGWEPHPMNTSVKMQYLTGGDAYFGPNLGESSVYTVTRRHFAEDCPNLDTFFKNLRFDLKQENILMGWILEKHMAPKDAAKKWLFENPDIATGFLQNVTTIKGKSGVTAIPQKVARAKSGAIALANKKIPIGHWAEEGMENINSHFAAEFNTFSERLEHSIRALIHWLAQFPPFAFAFFLALVVYALRRSIYIAIGTLLGLSLIVNLGLWVPTLETLVLILLATSISVVIGVPIGIALGHRPWVYKIFNPVLDLMQTIPTFVYLIPTLMLFGLGLVPGLISTIIFAMPAPIRLTYLGIRQIPLELLEAGEAFGATKRQLLWQVELPHAKATIMEGVSQCIMLSLSMVVVAALVGADGLGAPVVRALNTVNIGLGFDAGLSIVIIAILLDRILRSNRKGQGK